jgi:outer membrane receptor for ferric coprogen and ferric-rhodotorulic acid
MFSKSRLSCAIIATLAHVSPFAAPAFASESTDSQAAGNQAPQQETTLSAVKVTEEGIGSSEGSGSYTVRSTATATGLSLSPRDTPQSFTVITRERLDDQEVTNVFDALRFTTGVSVKAVDRGRSGISVRGFDVTVYQFDGTPTTLAQDNNVNTAMFDRIEVVRGATGLMTGAGDPSAAVNLVRKHANSSAFTGKVSVALGSWDQRSGSMDVTTPLNESGSIRARFVADYSKQNSFIDYEETQNTLLYGVIDADLTENTLLSIGASEQRDDRDGVLWAGLPVWFDDGSRADWSRSKTTAAKWNTWDVTTNTLFASLEHTFQNQWVAKGNFNHIETDDQEDMLWLWGNPNRETGEGMIAYPYNYIGSPEQTSFDAMARGPFQLWGREHEATFGAMRSEYIDRWSNRDTVAAADPATGGFPAGNLFAWDGSYPEQPMTPRYKASKSTTTQTAAYAATRLQLTDPLKAILGVRVSDWKREDDQAAWTAEAAEYKQSGVVTPYAGLVYDLTEQLSAYGSYTNIFNPQTLRTRDGSYLDPLEGDSYELGVKGEFMNGALNTTVAIFQTEQDNFGVADGVVTSKPSETAYRAADGVEVKGYELEASGEIQPGWNLSVGWTQYSAKDADDEDVAVDHPRKLFKLFTKYKMQGALQGLSVGGGLNWEGSQPARAPNPLGVEEKVGQGAYGLVDVMAKYDFDEHWSLQANIYNVFDKQYASRNTAWWGGAYTYGEPRKLLVSMDYSF